MDFVSDALFDERRLRLLTVIDLYTRECPGICVGQNLRSKEVAEMLNSIALRRPLPQLLKIDTGSEFAGKCWTSGCMKEGLGSTSHAREYRRTTLRWSPSTAGCGRNVLFENWFMPLEDARCKIQGWRILYNQSRPHSALSWMTSSEFAEKSAGCQNMQPE